MGEVWPTTHVTELFALTAGSGSLETEMSTDPKVAELREGDAEYGASYVKFHY